MGDGSLKHNSDEEQRFGNQSIEVVSINKKFIDHLYAEYYPFFTEPSIRRSAKESAHQAMASDVVSSPDDSVFRTQYRVVSRALPFFNRYDSWKRSGQKRWPNDIEFTPDRLKYLYVADGGLSWNKKTNSSRSQITSSNEPEQLERLSEYLKSIGVDCSVYDDRIMMKPSSTDKFLNYLGEPVPGFEYKWRNKSLEEYENLYQKVYYPEEHTYTV